MAFLKTTKSFTYSIEPRSIYLFSPNLRQTIMASKAKFGTSLIGTRTLSLGEEVEVTVDQSQVLRRGQTAQSSEELLILPRCHRFERIAGTLSLQCRAYVS